MLLSEQCLYYNDGDDKGGWQGDGCHWVGRPAGVHGGRRGHQGGKEGGSVAGWKQDKRSETVAMMMILIVDGVVMDIIEMMVDKQADLVLHMEVDKVTKEKRKVD